MPVCVPPAVRKIETRPMFASHHLPCCHLVMTDTQNNLLSVIVIQQKWALFRIPFDSRSPFASCRWQSFHNQWVSYHSHLQVRCSFYSAFQFVASKNDEHGRVGSQSGHKWETPHPQACSPIWSHPPLFCSNAPASQKFQSQIGSEIPLNCIPRSVVCSGKVICCKNFLNSEPFLLPLQKLID